ncbi:MAG: MBL fold metallo-hydrolase [Gammaproteobacteria bacterium]|jgi:glyoxylase-like metal-dependent hydrolase (beta-lactamase superfamily II)
MAGSIDYYHDRSISISKTVAAMVMLVGLFTMQQAVADGCNIVESKNYPSSWKLPATAIDTEDIPAIELDPDAPDSRPLPVYQLDDHTYFLFGNISTLNEKNRGFNANAGFVVTGEGVIVIDSLGTPKLGRRFISTVKCVTDEPIKYLVVTHNHPDHAYGAAAFQAIEGITIIAHPGTVDYNHSETLQTSVEYREQLLSHDMAGFRPLNADTYVKSEPFNKLRISLGKVIMDVFNTGKHHSYGDLVIHQPRAQFLWVSDLVFNQRTTYMGDGDSAQILEAQDWLMQTFPDARLMIPGHGSAQTPPFPMLAKTQDYVKRMREAMLNAVEDGTMMLDAVQNVEFEDWQDVPLYDSNQRANANFVYREMEKAYFENF